MTLSEFIARHKLLMTYEKVDRNPNMTEWMEGCSHYKCMLYCYKREMIIYFSMGPAHKSGPTIAEVLLTIMSDSCGVENEGGFEDWASEYGFDSENQFSKRVYRLVKKQTEDTRELLGEDLFTELMNLENMG